MKKSISILIFLLISVRTFSQSFVNPDVEWKADISVYIKSVEITDNYTQINFVYNNHTPKGHYVFLNLPEHKNAYYIKANEKKYKLLSTKHIGNSNEITLAPLNKEVEFSAKFESLPRTTTRFDLIEGESGSWDFYGVSFKQATTNSKTPQEWLELSRAETKKENYTKALEYFNKWMAVDTFITPMLYYWRGELSYKNKNYENTISDLNKFIQYYYEDRNAYTLLGFCYDKLSNIELAKKNFNIAYMAGDFDLANKKESSKYIDNPVDKKYIKFLEEKKGLYNCKIYQIKVGKSGEIEVLNQTTGKIGLEESLYIWFKQDIWGEYRSRQIRDFKEETNAYSYCQDEFDKGVKGGCMKIYKDFSKVIFYEGENSDVFWQYDIISKETEQSDDATPKKETKQTQHGTKRY